jgi:hypothetical protein
MTVIVVTLLHSVPKQSDKSNKWSETKMAILQGHKHHMSTLACLFDPTRVGAR